MANSAFRNNAIVQIRVNIQLLATSEMPKSSCIVVRNCKYNLVIFDQLAAGDRIGVAVYLFYSNLLIK